MEFIRLCTYVKWGLYGPAERGGEGVIYKGPSSWTRWRATPDEPRKALLIMAPDGIPRTLNSALYTEGTFLIRRLLFSFSPFFLLSIIGLEKNGFCKKERKKNKLISNARRKDVRVGGRGNPSNSRDCRSHYQPHGACSEQAALK